MRKLLLLIVVICVLALGLPAFFWTIGDLRSYRMRTAPMSPTFVPGDQFLVEALSYRFRNPHRGEIVVFPTAGILAIPQSEPPQPSPLYVMRIIGLPGDKIELRDQALFVNDKEDPVSSSIRLRFAPHAIYLSASGSQVKVPSNSYFVIGNNNTNSYDSGYWGCCASTKYSRPPFLSMYSSVANWIFVGQALRLPSDERQVMRLL